MFKNLIKQEGLSADDVNDALTEDDAGEAAAEHNVKAIQTALIKRGFHCGVTGATGELNDDTIYAIRTFQNFNGLPITGIIDNKTFEKINAD